MKAITELVAQAQRPFVQGLTRKRPQEADDGWMLHPLKSRFRRNFDMLVTVLIFHSCLVVPFRIAFDLEPTNLDKSFDRLVDCVFLLDVILNFFTGYIHNGEIVVEQAKVAKRYASSWLAVDLLSSLPFDLLASNDEPMSAALFNVSLQAKDVLRTNTLLRILRVLRIMRIFHRFSSTLRMKYSHFMMVKFGLVVCLVAHWLACGSFFVARFEGVRTHSWFKKYQQFDQMHNYTMEDQGMLSAYSMYVLSIYHAIMVMATIDINFAPESNGERLFAIFGMVLGSSVFCFYMSVVTRLLYSHDPAQKWFEKKMDRVVDFMNSYQFDQGLQLRVREMYDNLHTRNHFQPYDDILRDMTVGLRKEVLFKICHAILDHNSYFAGVENEIIGNVLLRMKQTVYTVGESIVRERQVSESLLFLSFGVAEIVVPEEREGPRSKLLGPGDVMGHTALLAALKVKGGVPLEPVTITACTFCEAYFLPRASILEICDLYPSLAKRWTREARSWLDDWRQDVLPPPLGADRGETLHTSALAVSGDCEPHASLLSRGGADLHHRGGSSHGGYSHHHGSSHGGGGGSSYHGSDDYAPGIGPQVAVPVGGGGVDGLAPVVLTAISKKSPHGTPPHYSLQVVTSPKGGHGYENRPDVSPHPESRTRRCSHCANMDARLDVLAGTLEKALAEIRLLKKELGAPC